MRPISRRKFIQRGALALIAAIALDSLWFEKYIIDWNFYDISRSQNKIRFFQITDLHFNVLRSFHKSIAERINKSRPDLVFITGDSVDSTEKIAALNSFLKLIDPKIKKFAITGNWEYWGNVDLKYLSEVYAENNCELLINETRHLTINDRTINVVGIDDFVGGTADFKAATKNIKDADTTIVLSHCPEHRDIIKTEMSRVPVDLILSGHTHGGQIAFFGWAPFKPQGSGNYLRGWYNESSPKMYISKGIGTSVLPVRFGSRAEMVEMHI